MIPHKKLKTWDFFVGTLEFRTPYHIASSQGNVETDAGLLRNSNDIIYIPGTSIAGALRSRAQEICGDVDLINAIFGYQDSQEGKKSRIYVEDTYLNTYVSTTIKDGVAIDRKLGSARDKAKYDLEISPANLSFPLQIKLEMREGDGEEMRKLVIALLKDFRDGKIRLGGGKSRGLGSCSFDFKWYQLNFQDQDKVAKYLINKDITKLHNKDLEDYSIETESAELVCEIEMEAIDSPFLIKSGQEGDDYDAVFTTVQKNGSETEYIPGSSIKGVIRAHAEKILRTIGGNACDISDSNCNCNKDISDKLPDNATLEDRSKIILENSCSICKLFGNSYLASRIQFDDAFFEEAPAKKPFDHVAIDRFTGGAMEGKLFSELPVVEGKFKIRFVVKNPTPFDKILIAFILRDLMEGFPPVRFGYGKSKGHGELKFVSASIDGQKLEKSDSIKNTFGIEPTNEWWKGEGAYERRKH